MRLVKGTIVFNLYQSRLFHKKSICHSRLITCPYRSIFSFLPQSQCWNFLALYSCDSRLYLSWITHIFKLSIINRENDITICLLYLPVHNVLKSMLKYQLESEKCKQPIESTHLKKRKIYFFNNNNNNNLVILHVWQSTRYFRFQNSAAKGFQILIFTFLFKYIGLYFNSLN